MSKRPVSVVKDGPHEQRLERGQVHVSIRMDRINRRLTVRDYELGDEDSDRATQDLTALCQDLLELAQDEHLSKLIWLARPSEWLRLLGEGFVLEAVIPCFLQGEQGLFMARFTKQERRDTEEFVEEDQLIDEIRSLPITVTRREDRNPTEFEIVSWEDIDIDELCKFYDRIFKTYPTPLTEPGYIEKQLDLGLVTGWAALDEGKIISSAALERNPKQGNGEVTDCATDPKYRGKGLNQLLIGKLEAKARETQTGCLYAIARAPSFGMNRSLYQLGYTFGGRLVNHSHIAGQLEDMNIWYKNIT